MKNKEINKLLDETGELLHLGRSEIQSAISTRKNKMTVFVLAFLVFLIFDNVSSLGSRYAGGSINDFIQLGRFL